MVVFLLFSGAAARGELRLETHQSEVLGRQKSFHIYVPATSSEEDRFPVLYVLHGKWGSHEDWPSRGEAAEAARNYRMILVFPDGEPFSWYLDSPLVPESQLESYIVRDLVPYVDGNFPTMAGRDTRGIMGLSMGGHGALMLAAKYPDMFGSASSLSGILKLTSHPYREDVEERLGPWLRNRELWEENSVWDLAPRFQTANVRLLFDCGRDDNATGAIWDSRLLHERLVKLNVPHIWREHAGTHSWDYWREHLPEHLNFHQAAMIEPMEGVNRWWKHYFQRIRLFLDENARLALDPPPEEKPIVAMLGASTIEGFRPTRLEKHCTVYNRGISSDILGIGGRGLSKRMEESAFDMKPDIVVIKMGANDIGNRERGTTGEPSEERMLDEMKAIIARLKDRLPDVRIIVYTCQPVRGRFDFLAPALKSWVDAHDTLAEETGVEILDIHTPFVGEDGLIREEYTTDGLHMTPAAKGIQEDLLLEALGLPLDVE